MHPSKIRLRASYRVTYALALCGLGLAVPAGAQTVHIYNFDFGTAGHVHQDPTINVGDTVTWIWDVNNSHSTTSVAGLIESWNSGVFNTAGHTFTHTFTNAGSFPYYCQIHGFDAGGGTAGGMSGRIIVNAPTTPEPGALALLGGALIPGAGLLLRRRRARVR